MAGSNITEECEEHTALYLLHLWYMGKLFPALLPDVFLFLLYVTFRLGLCYGYIRGGEHCSVGAYSKWCWSMAFCRQDNAHSIWCGRPKCPLLRSHCTYRADYACDTYGRFCMGSVGFSITETSAVGGYIAINLRSQLRIIIFITYGN